MSLDYLASLSFFLAAKLGWLVGWLAEQFVQHPFVPPHKSADICVNTKNEHSLSLSRCATNDAEHHLQYIYSIRERRGKKRLMLKMRSVGRLISTGFQSSSPLMHFSTEPNCGWLALRKLWLVKREFRSEREK